MWLIELTKPKVTLLNLLVGVTCFVLAAYPSVDLLKLTFFAIAGYLAAGGCAVLNCVYDIDLDKLMPRTSKRALPSGEVNSKEALVYGITLTGIGLAISGFFFNLLTASMMLLGVAFYLAVYTVWLKRTSPWNVVVGGLAGCFAGLAGWTAVTNTFSLVPLLISLVDFLWTPGHLWALAMKKVQEYKKAGIPMLPVTAGLGKTAKITFLFNLSAIASSLFLPFLGLTGLIYGATAVSLGVWFLFESQKLAMHPTEAGGFRVFLASMPYLAILMVALIIDKVHFGI
jgi:heme o synthase